MTKIILLSLTISQIQMSQRSVSTSAFWPQPSWQAMSLTCLPSPPEGEEVSSKHIVIFMHILNHYQAYNIMNISRRINNENNWKYLSNVSIKKDTSASNCFTELASFIWKKKLNIFSITNNLSPGPLQMTQQPLSHHTGASPLWIYSWNMARMINCCHCCFDWW